MLQRETYHTVLLSGRNSHSLDTHGSLLRLPSYRPSEKVAPKFSDDQCLRYFESVVSPSTSYSGFPDWISEVWHLPESTSEFDMSAIRPSEVK